MLYLFQSYALKLTKLKDYVRAHPNAEFRACLNADGTLILPLPDNVVMSFLSSREKFVKAGSHPGAVAATSSVNGFWSAIADTYATRRIAVPASQSIAVKAFRDGTVRLRCEPPRCVSDVGAPDCFQVTIAR